jgi:hypothetical protein
MYKWMFLAAIAVCPALNAANTSKTCFVTYCRLGDKAVTYSKKSDPYFACPSKELSDYTNGVLGLIEVSHQLSGSVPHTSSETGEPEYVGQSKARIDSWRESAGVNTFHEALAKCKKGADKTSVVLMGYSGRGDSIRVRDKSDNTFWMPTEHLIKN